MAEKNKQEELVVMRLRKDLHTRLVGLADKKCVTLTALTNAAIKRYLETHEITIKDLLEVIEQIPSLKLHKEIIKKELDGCPSTVCKQIINMVHGRRSFVFEGDFETTKAKIESLGKSNLYGLFMNISMKHFDMNKSSDFLNQIQVMLKKNNSLLEAGLNMGNSEKDRILMFVSYKKEDDKNVREKSNCN